MEYNVETVPPTPGEIEKELLEHEEGREATQKAAVSLFKKYIFGTCCALGLICSTAATYMVPLAHTIFQIASILLPAGASFYCWRLQAYKGRLYEFGEFIQFIGFVSGLASMASGAIGFSIYESIPHTVNMIWLGFTCFAAPLAHDIHGYKLVDRIKSHCDAIGELQHIDPSRHCEKLLEWSEAEPTVKAYMAAIASQGRLALCGEYLAIEKYIKGADERARIARNQKACVALRDLAAGES